MRSPRLPGKAPKVQIPSRQTPYPEVRLNRSNGPNHTFPTYRAASVAAGGYLALQGPPSPDEYDQAEEWNDKGSRGKVYLA